MNSALVEKIANTILYEGYILYPYRASAVKNRQRWNFGVLYPQAYSVAQEGTDAWTMQTECLVLGRDGSRTAPTLNVKVRFLHLLAREVGELLHPLGKLTNDKEPDLRVVDSLQVGNKLFQTWQEAVEREIIIHDLRLDDLFTRPERLKFAFPPLRERETEPLYSPTGEVVGVIVRRQQPIEGAAKVKTERVGEEVFKVTVRILNLTPFKTQGEVSRDEALMHSFVSTHTILWVREGEFISLLDPPEQFREAAAACSNVGTWPALVGDEGERGIMLSSPIILYDHPQIAPESAGDLFDGTEVDELLTLRIMTLTDEEKREMRETDERARQILERTETLPTEQLMKLHGAVRHLRPLKKEEEKLMDSWNPLEEKPRPDHIHVRGVDLKPGDRVRLRPRQGGSDIFDVALEGKTATIESIEQDFEDRIYIAVTVDDDPGKNFGIQRMPAHRFFFSPEEVEPLGNDKGRDL